MSGVASVLVLASFAAPIAMSGAGEVFVNQDSGYLAMSVVFLVCVGQYTVIFFFNSALVGAALIRLDGGDPTVSDGLAIASKRMASILGYAGVAATVGMILRMISERGGIFAKIAAMVGGVAWTMATYLAVPVLVTKNIGPIDAIKESGQIFRRTWGEQISGNFGLSWALSLVFVGWTVASFAVGWVGATLFGPTAVLPVLGISVLGFLFFGLMASAPRAIYTAALYRYAMTGDAGAFDARFLGGAFSSK